MRIIELSSKKLDLPKLKNQGNESTIYMNGNTLYKIFNDDVNVSLKEESIDFLYKNKDKLNGIIMPNEKLAYNSKFVGHTMDFYECVSVDKYFDYSIDFSKRYHYSLNFLDIFNRMNNIGAEHTDFHTDNILISKDGSTLIGDCSSIKNKNISVRYKQEQLIVLMSLLTGFNLMNEVNNIACISELIEQIGSDALLDYYYKPEDSLDSKLLKGITNNPEKVKGIVRLYGGL